MTGRTGTKRPSGWVNPRKGVPSGKARPIEERFWEKVNKNGPTFEDKGPCWLWTGSKNNTGYGQIHSLEPGDPAMITAHRFSLRLAGIFLENGMEGGKPVCDHLCKNRLCVNPEHIRVTTQRINSTENSDSPMAKLARRKSCSKGHLYTPETTLYVKRPGGVSRNGKRRGACTARVCLVCQPNAGKRKAKQQSKPGNAEAALDAMTRNAEELGLYDEPQAGGSSAGTSEGIERCHIRALAAWCETLCEKVGWTPDNAGAVWDSIRAARKAVGPELHRAGDSK